MLKEMVYSLRLTISPAESVPMLFCTRATDSRLCGISFIDLYPLMYIATDIVDILSAVLVSLFTYGSLAASVKATDLHGDFGPPSSLLSHSSLTSIDRALDEHGWSDTTALIRCQSSQVAFVLPE